MMEFKQTVNWVYWREIGDGALRNEMGCWFDTDNGQQGAIALLGHQSNIEKVEDG